VDRANSAHAVAFRSIAVAPRAFDAFELRSIPDTYCGRVVADSEVMKSNRRSYRFPFAALRVSVRMAAGWVEESVPDLHCVLREGRCSLRAKVILRAFAQAAIADKSRRIYWKCVNPGRAADLVPLETTGPVLAALFTAV